MIAAALRDEVDKYASVANKTNPIFVKAGDGTLGLGSIAFYLENIRVLLATSPRQLAAARVAALGAGDVELAKHYRHKLREEVGHDRWAEEDIETLRHRTELAGVSAGESMRALIRWIDAIIEEDPALYLGYILFSEYLIVLLGPEWLHLLETRCNLPRSSMTVIGKHAELDRDHVDEAMAEIDRLVADPRKLRRMRQVVVEATQLFHQFCEEVCAQQDLRHAPAA